MSNEFEKVTIASVDDPVPIYVTSMYNPKSLSFTKSVTWTGNKGGAKTDYPTLQFTSGNAITLSVELFFDKYEEEGDVRPEILKLMQFVHKHDELDDGRPPMVQLIWGGKVGESISARLSSGIDPLGIGKPFRGVVNSVETTYTMFLENGTPCRASAKVSLTQADAIEMDSGSSDGSENSTSYSNSVDAVNHSENREDTYEKAEASGGRLEDNNPISI